MIPINRFMEYPQPFQGTHVPYPHHYYPSWVPPRTKLETTKSPEPWFYGGSYGFPNVGECHGCCNHSYPSGYYNLKPLHSYLPPPPSFYPCGPYSPYVDLHPPHYFPPHYSMEQPKNEINKTLQTSHCCGCPNHTCNAREDEGVKIEEHDPEVEKKESEPLGLTQLENYGYPFLWVPPEYMKNRSASKLSQSDPTVLNGWFPFDMKKNKEGSKNLDSKVCNGKFPFDQTSIKPSGRDEDNDRSQNQKKEEERELQIPYPIIWTPSYDKQEVDKAGLKENSAKESEIPKMKYKIIPVKFPYNLNHGAEAESVEDTPIRVEPNANANEIEDKRSSVTERGEKHHLEDHEKNIRDIPVKKPEEHGDAKYSSNENAKRRSPSPSKTKLPPVCLRVEPLHRRKSRSLSPPSLKETVKGVDYVSKSEKQQDSTPKEPVCNVVKTKNVEDQGKKLVSNEEVPGIMITESREDKNEVEEGTELAKEKKKEMKKISSVEAAVKIQSTYRGFEVRKWEPLKKLRHIVKVREQVNEVRNQIRGFESSDTRINEKQMVFISETIMSLLLQLDTIQGLHPSLRDVRKSVARELVCLQEQLDALKSQKKVEVLASRKADEECNVKRIEDNGETKCNSESMQAGLTEKSLDSELEKYMSSGTDEKCVQLTAKAKESEQELLNIPSFGVEEIVHHSISEAQSIMQPTPTGDGNGEPCLCSILLENEKSNLTSEEQLAQMEEKSSDSDRGSGVVEFGLLDSSRENRASDEEHQDLADLPVEVLDKELDSFNMEQIDFGKVVLEEAEQKLQEPMLLLVQEESREEHLMPENNYVQMPIEEDKLCDADVSEFVNDLSPNSVDSTAKFEEVMEEPNRMGEDKNNTTVEENELCKVEELTTGQMNSLGAAFTEGSTNDERKDAKDMEAIVDIDKIVDNSTVEGKQMDVAAEEEKEGIVDIDKIVDSSSVVGNQMDVAAEEEKVGVDASLYANVDEPSLNGSEEEKKLVKENEKLRDMLEKLIQAGNEQLTVITDLNGRVKELEKKLMKKQKLRMKSKKTAGRSLSARTSCIAPK